MKLVLVKDVRYSLNIPKISGCYEFWAEKDELDFILDILDPNKIVCLNKIEKISYDGKDLYGVYVGQANCLLSRICSHLGINSSSSFRKSIHALLTINHTKCHNVDDFLDKLYLEFPIHEASSSDEKKIIEKYFRPLNDKNNKYYRDIINRLIDYKKVIPKFR